MARSVSNISPFLPQLISFSDDSFRTQLGARSRSGPRLKGDNDDEEEKFDAMGNKIVSTKKAKKLTSAELRKKKKDRMARRKRGEDVFCKYSNISPENTATANNFQPRTKTKLPLPCTKGIGFVHGPGLAGVLRFICFVECVRFHCSPHANRS